MTRDQLAVELQLKQDEKVALMEKYIQCLEGQSDPGTDKAQLKRQRYVRLPSGTFTPAVSPLRWVSLLADTGDLLEPESSPT